MAVATCKGCKRKVIWGAAGGRLMAVDATPVQAGPGTFEVFKFHGSHRIRPHRGSPNVNAHPRHDCAKRRERV